jgi:HEAT repeat protein
MPDDGLEPSSEVVASFQAALAGILARQPRAFDVLKAFHREAPPELSDAIVMAVGDAGHSRGLVHLEHVLSFSPESTGLCASQVRRLGRSGDLDLDRALAQRLRWAVDPDRPADCRALLLALGELRDYEAVPLLIDLLESEDRGTAGNAHWALKRITELEFAAAPERWRTWHESELTWFAREEDAVLRALHVGSPSAAAAAARAIGERRLWREDLALELLHALARPQPALRSPICRAIERLGVDNVTAGLVELLDDSDPASAKAAWQALVALTGRELPADAMTWRLALAGDS